MTAHSSSATSPLELLIEQVGDPDLRSKLTEQFRSLRGQKSFGLNFEEHADEAVRIPGVRVTRKTTVQPVAEPGARVYDVRRITDGTATIVRAGEQPRDIAVDELVVARKLGDPVYMGLTSTGDIRRGGGKPAHLVIEGENYHALQTLLYTHEGKVDVIYIDPPYNTGAGDWIYNDRYVGDSDAYRHSKWLSFMDKRLRLAKRLLTPTGVIIVAIDDNEHHRLRILMDTVFGERNFLVNVVWQGGGSSLSRFDAGGIDYMVVYGRDISALTTAGVRWKVEKEGLQDVLDAAAGAWEKSGHDADVASKLLSSWWTKNKPKYDPGLGDNVKVDSNGVAVKVIDLGNSVDRPNLKYPVTDPATGIIYQPPGNGWAVKREVMDDLIAKGRVLFGGRPRMKTPLTEMSMRNVMPSFYKDRRGASQYLSNVLGSSDFPYPKDVDTVARWLNIASSRNPNAVFLDFFAGTGTTAEAVMRLNAQDGGHRQAVIVTSNELAQKTAKELTQADVIPGSPEWEAQGVYQKVTKPRIATVVTGIRSDGSSLTDSVVDDEGKKVASAIAGASGYNENVVFGRLSYLDRTDIELGRQFAEIAPLLYMQAGAVGDIISDRPKAFALAQNYGILTDTSYRREFVDAVNSAAITHAYIVTDDPAQFQGVAGMLDVGVTAHHLAEDYLVNFTINTGDVT